VGIAIKTPSGTVLVVTAIVLFVRVKRAMNGLKHGKEMYCLWPIIMWFLHCHTSLTAGQRCILVCCIPGCLIPAGVLAANNQWQGARNDHYLFPVKALSVTYRGKMLAYFVSKLMKA
jgi:hypothetical protein